MKKIINYKFFIWGVLVFLSSCNCKHTDLRVSKGFPYDGKTFEVNYEKYEARPGIPNYSFKFPVDMNKFFISDTNTCNTMLKANYPNYECNIDFSKYDLVHIEANSDEHNNDWQIRVLVNHHSKNYFVEIRTNSQNCSEGQDLTDFDSHIEEFILVPKIPANYKFHIDKYGAK